MKYILILGAKSDIAKEIARVYAKNGYNLCLASRNAKELEILANDIKIRSNVDVKIYEFDIVDFASHEQFYSSLDIKPSGVVLAAGYMVEQSLAQTNQQESLNTLNVNFCGAVGVLNIIANDFELRSKNEKDLFIAGISSVAGDRGRASNYIYGSAKAGFSAYLSGLRNRLAKCGVNVLTIKPGFVATKMTSGLYLPPKLTVMPEQVANDIFKAQQSKKSILYTKKLWFFIMLIIKHIPEFIFKKMSI